MIRLILVELKKIFHKKSIYIVLFLMILMCALNNILFYIDEGINPYTNDTKETSQKEKSSLENDLKNYDKTLVSDQSMYLSIKTKLDLINLKEKYPNSSWQYQKIEEYLYDIVYEINTYKEIKSDASMLNLLEEKYDTLIDKFNKDNWQYFIKLKRDSLIKEKETLLAQKKEISELSENEVMDEKINEIKRNIWVTEYRLKNLVKEDNNYLSKALDNYLEYSKVLATQSKISNKTKAEEKEYKEIKKNLAIEQYILKHKTNINKMDTLNYQLRTIIEDYEIFFVILILIVISITICEEFQTGTIKLLLIKPYSRGKILLGKYIASILVILFSMLLLILTELLLGVIFFGLDSLNLPVVIYSYAKESVVEYPIIYYMLIRILSMLPFFLIFLTITTILGVLLMNTITTITCPLILYMFTPTLKELATNYQLKFMKYFIFMNWNFEDYLFGALPDYPYISLKFSSITYLIYFISMICITFIIFKKKNIRNI